MKVSRAGAGAPVGNMKGLDSLSRFGYAAVVTLGDPALLPAASGFELAAHYDLHCRWRYGSAFRVHRLAEDALEGVTGLVEHITTTSIVFKHRRFAGWTAALKTLRVPSQRRSLALCELFDTILYAQGQRAIADTARNLSSVMPFSRNAFCAFSRLMLPAVTTRHIGGYSGVKRIVSRYESECEPRCHCHHQRMIIFGVPRYKRRQDGHTYRYWPVGWRSNTW